MLRAIQTLIRMEWPVRLVAPLIGRFNPFLPEFRRDPYPAYRRLREADPIYFSPSLRGWILTRHGDVSAVLGDPRFTVDRRQSNAFRRFNPFGSLHPEFADAIYRSLLMLDAPDHTRLRKLVVKAFTPRMVERLRTRIEALVDELLDAVADRGEMDLVRDLSYPLPVIVIAEMLGIPAADRERLKRWSDDLATLLDPLQATNGLRNTQRAYLEFVAYLQPILEARRAEPQDDLISALVAARDGADALSDAELRSLCMLILGAGNETTTSLIGNAVLALLRHPAVRRALIDDPSQMRPAIEEFLRYDSPVQFTDRVASVDLEIEGRKIRRGELVGLVLGAANRDPAVYSDPDRLLLGRDEAAHVAFGQGAHFCLGAQLARLETEVALNRLLQRFPTLHGPDEPPSRKRSMVLRGPTSLPLRW